MSGEKVVMIFREGDDVNVCCIPFSLYPTGQVPEVGDKMLLHAKKTLLIPDIAGGVQKPTTITYFNHLVTVTDVWIGNGDLLHPNNGCPFYSFKDYIEGYGIRVSVEAEKIPAGIRPVQAEVIFGF